MMANGSLTPFVRVAAILLAYCRRMDHLFIAGRTSLTDAQELMREFGHEASLQAAVRAEKSRGAENILKFCHWRQVERLIDALAADEPPGTVH
jgi:hypothetical protein